MSAQKIIEGAKEAVAWTKGEGTARVHLPGQPSKDMTADECRAAMTDTTNSRAEHVAAGMPDQGAPDLRERLARCLQDADSPLAWDRESEHQRLWYCNLADALLSGPIAAIQDEHRREMEDLRVCAQQRQAGVSDWGIGHSAGYALAVSRYEARCADLEAKLAEAKADAADLRIHNAKLRDQVFVLRHARAAEELSDEAD